MTHVNQLSVLVWFLFEWFSALRGTNFGFGICNLKLFASKNRLSIVRKPSKHPFDLIVNDFHVKKWHVRKNIENQFWPVLQCVKKCAEFNGDVRFAWNFLKWWVCLWFLHLSFFIRVHVPFLELSRFQFPSTVALLSRLSVRVRVQYWHSTGRSTVRVQNGYGPCLFESQRWPIVVARSYTCALWSRWSHCAWACDSKE